MLAMQMKDWAKAERLFEELKRVGYGDDGVVESYLAQVAEETGRYESRSSASRPFRKASAGGSRSCASRRCSASSGASTRRARYLAELPAVTREQQVQVQQADAQLLRDAGDNKAAYEVLDERARRVSRRARPPLRPRDGRREARPDRRRSRRSSRGSSSSSPTNAQALNALGYTLVDRTPRVAEGLALIERALKLAPDDPFILDSVGWAQFRLGPLDEAEKYLRHAMEQRPDPEIAAHLGEVLWAKGERALAQDVWQSQLKNAPDNAVLLETVRRLTR